MLTWSAAVVMVKMLGCFMAISAPSGFDGRLGSWAVVTSVVWS